MQLPSETLIYNGWEMNAALPADNAEAVSGEHTGSSFSDLLRTPVVEPSPESTAEPTRPSAGGQLPLETLMYRGREWNAGLTAGSAHGLQTRMIEYSAESTAQPAPALAGIPLPPAGNTLPPTDNLVPAADRDAATGTVRYGTSSGALEAASPGSVKGFAGARILTARPGRADLPVDSVIFKQNGNSGERSERTHFAPENSGKSLPVLPSPGATQTVPPADSSRGRQFLANMRELAGEAPENLAVRSSISDAGARGPGDRQATLPPAVARGLVFSEPRPGIALRSRVPAAEIVDTVPQPPILLKETRAPIIRGYENKWPADSNNGKRDNFASSALPKLHDNDVDTSNRVIQELKILKMPAQTRATKRSLPAAQPTFATVPISGASPALSMPATAPVVTIDAPVLDRAWADALQERVLWLAGRNIQIAEIRLNPAELGPLRVQISVGDNSVDIAFTATHAVTREALEIALPRLKDMLAENGMSLADASVSDQGTADRREDGKRAAVAEFDQSVEDSTLAVGDLLPDRPTIEDPTALVDTYI